jgi:hypothetical protein
MAFICLRGSEIARDSLSSPESLRYSYYVVQSSSEFIQDRGLQYRRHASCIEDKKRRVLSLLLRRPMFYLIYANVQVELTIS